MKLKQKKCEFNQHRVEYLGHIISEQGMSPSETKVQAMKDGPEPTNVKELKAFLGLLRAGFAKFVSDLASLVCRQESTVEMRSKEAKHSKKRNRSFWNQNY